mmetsp:Transcript_11742/g.30647  ORF Transcript_11742/g.30647 Transcript_11742/m.30647 type:complete len:243 (+) Transcript_11742:803-1531(+)
MGKKPDSIVKRHTPALHASAGGPAYPRDLRTSTSGATYDCEPTTSRRRAFGLSGAPDASTASSAANPKSASFTVQPSSASRTFSSLMSRWITPRPCRWRSPARSPRMYTAAFGSGTRPKSVNRSKSSPPLQSSMNTYAVPAGPIGLLRVTSASPPRAMCTSRHRSTFSWVVELAWRMMRTSRSTVRSSVFPTGRSCMILTATSTSRCTSRATRTSAKPPHPLTSLRGGITYVRWLSTSMRTS